MDNKNKIISILTFVILLLVGFLFITKNNQKNNTSLSVASTTDIVSTSSSSSESTSTVKIVKTTPTLTAPKSSTSMCNIKITFPVANSKITFPLMIAGVIDLESKSDCVWNNNLSMGGSVEIYYNLKNTGWKSAGIPASLYTSGTGGSTSTLAVKANVNMYTEALGLVSGTPIKLVFTELNIINNSNPKTFSYITYLK